MQQHTALTRQDLRVYLSQRLTDTEDGGGGMTARAMTGAKNELFPPPSDVDRSNGAVDVRLVYPGVLKPVAAQLLGAHMILSGLPEAANVSFLLFRASHFGETRSQIMPRMEAYSVPTVESMMTLLGTQTRGSRTVQVYQREDVPLPVVGERYCLQYLDDQRQKQHEYFRVDSFTESVLTFEDEHGVFSRRVLSIKTQQPLSRDFEGLETAARQKAAPAVKVLRTQVADSAAYYGARPLAEQAQAGAAAVQVDGIFEKLVPTGTVETAIPDDFAGGVPLWVATGARRMTAPAGHYPADIFLDGSVLPGSVELEGFADNGLGRLEAADGSVLAVDYAQGVIEGAARYVAGVYAVPAAACRNYAYSASQTVDDTNLGTEFVQTLRPLPAAGSTEVSFRTGGTRYVLRDAGDYRLRDVQGQVRGTVNPLSGTVSLSLPAVPDAGSRITASWSPADCYRAYGGGALASPLAPQAVSARLRLPETPLPHLKPGTVRLAWDGKQARDDGGGKLTGDCTGTVDYAGGQVYPAGITAAEITLTAEQYTGMAAERTVPTGDSADYITLTIGTCRPGTVSLALGIARVGSNGQTVPYPALPSFSSGSSSSSGSGGASPGGGGRRGRGQLWAYAG